jgi:hypothetical protein
MQEQAKKLAEEHWSYVGEVVKQGAGSLAYLTQEQIIDIIKFHYISAFIHGYKHGVESRGGRIEVRPSFGSGALSFLGEPGNYE